MISTAKSLTDQRQWVQMLILSDVVRKRRGIPEQRVKAVRRTSMTSEGESKAE